MRRLAILLTLSLSFQSIAPALAQAGNQKINRSLLNLTRSESSCAYDVERWKSCEEVLDSAELAIKTQADTIEALVEQNEQLKKALEAGMPIIERSDAWYKNQWLWFGVGVIAGGLATRELSR